MKDSHSKLSHNITVTSNDALIIIDVQNDFLPGGNLAVSDGHKIIPPLNSIIKLFESKQLPIFFSRDWHPENHCSFQTQHGLWPTHCVQNTWGAEFPATLYVPNSAKIISKATKIDQDAYSAFADTGLHDSLQTLKITRLFIGGLATDYCVLHSVRDAHALGYSLCILSEGIKAVNAQPIDEQNALNEIKNYQAIFI